MKIKHLQYILSTLVVVALVAVFLSAFSLVKAQTRPEDNQFDVVPTDSTTGIPSNAGVTSNDTGGVSSTDTGGVRSTGTPPPIPHLTNPLTTDSIETLILSIVDIAMNVGIVIATIMIIYAGFRLIWARGNATELEDAKKLFMYVIIGLAVLISAKAIVGIVKNTLIQAKVVDQSVFNRPQ